jgi:hypothetical protein
VLLVALALSGMLAMLGGGMLLRWPSLPALEVGGRTCRRRVIWLAALLVVGTAVVSLGGVYIRTLGMQTINPSRPARDVYEFVSALPKDAVLAGDPDLMTGIPLFSKRSVLFRGLFPPRNTSVVQFFDAQYAESAGEVLDFCKQYRVSHLVIDTTVYDADYLARGEFFYQPFNDEIVGIVAGRSDFVLPRLQPLYESGPFVVIECDAETILATS